MPPPQQTATSKLVKLYELDENQNWIDLCIGHCYYTDSTDDDNNNSDQIRIVSDKDDNDELYCFDVEPSKMYQRQQDKLILFTEDAKDLAISFQDPAKCQEVWDKLIKKGIVFDRPVVLSQHATGSDNTSDDEEYDHDVEFSHNDSPLVDMASYCKLPNLTIQHIADITDILQVANPMEKEFYAKWILQSNYFQQITETFNNLEDLEAHSDLHQLYYLMLEILFLDEDTLLEHIIQEFTFPSLLGILEYYPKNPNCRYTHRETVQNAGSAQSRLQELSTNSQLTKEINDVFRLRYLITVLSNQESGPDVEQFITSVTELIKRKNKRILLLVQHDEPLVNDVVRAITDGDLARKKESFGFIYGLFDMGKTLDITDRQEFYKAFAHNGLIDIFRSIFATEAEDMKRKSLIMLDTLVQIDPATVRTQIVEQFHQENGKTFMDFLIEGANSDFELRDSIFNSIRLLTEVNMNSSDQEEFLTMMYGDYMKQLYKFMVTMKSDDFKVNDIGCFVFSRDQADLTIKLMDLLIILLKIHGFRLKYFLLTNDLFPKIMLLCRANHLSLQLCPVRFLRICFDLRDEFFYTHFLKNEVFEPIVGIAAQNSAKDNLVSSACLAMFESIRKANNKQILQHLLANFRPSLESFRIEQTTVGDKLVQQLSTLTADAPKEEEKAAAGPVSDTVESPAPATAWSSMDQVEEDYFNTSDEDEEEEQRQEASDKGDEELVLPRKRKQDDEDEDEDDAFARSAMRRKIENMKRKFEGQQQPESNKKLKSNNL
ncbi:hypothetical protein BCV72DRAFT_265136 [Rhizopus microsporus var. microsporus]|uniref:Uncharacterized protein n=2 Tax=Rhizopus microsporus TaxID=58291 RepID=A0A2G4SZC0_RHIZD|nr:uncharacterized protein RHIMIDRAFT_312372 [Rhizopus microsporus ATCC 52813]ORE02507.1 hypothetical protein BCV72DRAFT_265136 [Rhizopus microsporus var. microsporus]PHZ14094.1 hypothetical protein RHIMIDRAFT_312372 [Rhizopus microsporus ATCC 52813]